MAAPTNTVNVLNTSVMESLSRRISDVTPTDTPFFSGIKRRSAKSYVEEWQVDELNDVVTTARPYGDDYSAETRRNPARRQNVLQTVWRSFTISDEEEKVRSAGFNSRMAFEIMKCGKEQKIDIENILINLNQASDIPTASNNVTGKVGSFMTWLETNTDRAGNGSDGGYSTSSKETDARTDGSRRAFTETQLVEVLQDLYENAGGIQGNVIHTNVVQKAKFGAFDGIAPMRNPQAGKMQATIIGAANVYLSSFGSIRMMLNRHMRKREVLVVKSAGLELRTFFMFRPKYLAMTGNNRKFGMSSSFTLCVKNEKQHGMVADLTE